MNSKCTLILLGLLLCWQAQAHDPVFSLGPHALFDGGFELTMQVDQSNQTSQHLREYAAEIGYGLTSNWSLFMAFPYADRTQGEESLSGWSDAQVFTKYRLMREDELGAQRSAAILLGVSLKNGKKGEQIDIGNDAVDSFFAVTYGSDTRQQYRWAGARYWRYGKDSSNLQQGSSWYFDYAWGQRLVLNGYQQQDWIALFELNAEFQNRNIFNGEKQNNSGGTLLFASPGIIWAYHNFSAKAGVQIPAYSALNETQDSPKKRLRLRLQWRI